MIKVILEHGKSEIELEGEVNYIIGDLVLTLPVAVNEILNSISISNEQKYKITRQLIKEILEKTNTFAKAAGESLESIITSLTQKTNIHAKEQVTKGCQNNMTAKVFKHK